MARRNAAEVLAGLLVLIVAAGFLAYALATSGAASVPGYPLSAEFDRIDGLTVGSDVRMAGVKVGSVTTTSIDPKTYLADVGFTVQKDIQLPTDSSASIASQSLLGGKYLSLVPGGSEQMIAPGGRVTITQGSVSLEDLLGKFIFSVTDLVSSLQKPGQKPASGVGASPMTAPGGVQLSPLPEADHWPRPDGTPVDCREKLRLLRENHADLEQTLRDCFDDAVLMGVDAEAMRHLLHGMVDKLRDPRNGGPGPR